MVQGEGRDGSDFKRMRLLPKFRFLRFLSRFIVHKRKERGRRRGRERGTGSVVNSSELGQTQRAKPVMHAWGLRVWGLPEPFGGLRYAFICVSISFLLRISFGLYFFRSSRLVSAFVLFCFTRKKTFQLTNAKQISNKSAKFPLTNKFLADFSLLCVCECICVYVCFACSAGRRGDRGQVSHKTKLKHK